MAELTREQLIGLCEAGVVPEAAWSNRDSAGAQRQLGECLALLRAGCTWEVNKKLYSYGSRTHWIDVAYKGFTWFEVGFMSTDTFYIPTSERLAEVSGKDWY